MLVFVVLVSLALVVSVRVVVRVAAQDLRRAGAASSGELQPSPS
jgi:hypothetical protein